LHTHTSACPHSATDSSPAAAAPETSIEFLKEQTERCDFASADIAGIAKRLAAGETSPVAAANDPAALKVEKNALAILFIPAIFALAEEILTPNPRMVFYIDPSGIQMMDCDVARVALDPSKTQAGLCQLIYRSMSAVFDRVAQYHLTKLRQDAIEGSPSARMTEALLIRYEAALTNYQGHTKATVAFTPTVHLMAGIHTALFFILRALSAITVLGARRLDRPITPAELSAAVKLSTPLLLTIARGHLEELLELEVLLGKGSNLFMTGVDSAAYDATIEAMFTLAPGDGLRLELSDAVRAALPWQLASEKPRTRCPALFSVTRDTENAIASLIRLVERQFASLAFGA